VSMPHDRECDRLDRPMDQPLRRVHRRSSIEQVFGSWYDALQRPCRVIGRDCGASASHDGRT